MQIRHNGDVIMTSSYNCTYIHVDIGSTGWYRVDCYLEVISDFVETISLSLKKYFIQRSQIAKK